MGAPAAEGDVRRRLAAVLAADAAGYSRLMSVDETATIAALVASRAVFRTQVEAHQGRIIDTAGDSVLAAFDTASGAIDAALAVQDALGGAAAALPTDRRMRFRIGLHLGDVVEKPDGTIYGDGVNIAARLQALAEPGGVTVSGAVQSAVRGRPGLLFTDLGEQQVKNIPRPVHAFRLVVGGRAQLAASIDRSTKPLGDKPSVAVLAFQNLSNDPEQEYFADGIAEDLLMALSRHRWLLVIARNSSFSYKGQAVDVRQVGKELGVRYVLEGSVRKVGSRVRVSCQLIEATTGNGVWADRYDRDVADIFELQDEITLTIACALEPELSRAELERARSKPADSLDCWDLVRRAIWHMNRITREDAATARELLCEALASNPKSVEALIYMAWWHHWDGWTRRGPKETWVEVERYARQAMALDGEDARALWLVGTAELMQGNAEGSRTLLQRAVRVNPSLAIGYATIGSSYILAGKPEYAIKPLRTAIRLSPSDFFVFHAYGECAVAHHMMEKHEEAIADAGESIRLRPHYLYAHVVRIGSLARLGRGDEAAAALAKFLAARPVFSRKDIDWLPFMDRRWNAYLVEGLALAGFQEQK